MTNLVRSMIPMSSAIDEEPDDDLDLSLKAGAREAKLQRCNDGELLGAAIWLNAADLAALGGDLSENVIGYAVERGQLIIE